MGFDTIKVQKIHTPDNYLQFSFVNISHKVQIHLAHFFQKEAICEGAQAEGEKFVYNLKNRIYFPNEIVTG